MAGERRLDLRVLSGLTTALTLACALVGCAGARDEADPGILDKEGLPGLWLRPARNVPTPFDEGLDIRPEGIFHLVGIHSMDGLTWRVEGDHLVLDTATERYPQPQPSTYRIERLTESALVLSGDSYLAGRYTRSPLPLPRLTARRRAAAISANRDRYCAVTRRLAGEESPSVYTAYFYPASRYQMQLRMIDAETVAAARSGRSRSAYFFEDGRLFLYRSEPQPRTVESDGPADGHEDLLMVSYGLDGQVEQMFKLVGGVQTSITGPELEAIQDDLDRYLADLRGTSDCRRTEQTERRDKRLRRLRERLGGGRGAGGR